MSEMSHEGWQPTGNFNQDLSDMAEAHKTPEQEMLEHKESEYAELAQMFVSSLSLLRGEELKHGADYLTSAGISSMLRKSVYPVIEDLPDETVFQVMADARKAAGGEVPPHVTRDGEENALKLMVGRGIGTGSVIMAAYFKMTATHYGEDELHRVGTSDTTLKTLFAITRAWGINEITEKFPMLGANSEFEARQSGFAMHNMEEKFFDFTPDGISIKPEHRHFFTSQDPLKVACPVAHRAGLEEHDQETTWVLPVKEIAVILLDKWQEARQTA